jgi:hypothetical protein
MFAGERNKLRFSLLPLNLLATTHVVENMRTHKPTPFTRTSKNTTKNNDDNSNNNNKNNNNKHNKNKSDSEERNTHETNRILSMKCFNHNNRACMEQQVTDTALRQECMFQHELRSPTH